MKMNSLLMMGGLAAATLMTSIVTADAASIKVRCEQRAGRSKISVDGAGLAAGNYKARIISGANQTTTTAPQASERGQVEFDFDSDRGDIAAGATAISPTFIQGGVVTGKILDANNFTVISDTVKCQAR